MGPNDAGRHAQEAARQAQENARRNAEIARRNAELAHQNAERGAELGRRSQWDNRRASPRSYRSTGAEDPRYIARYEGEGSHLFGTLLRLIVLVVVIAVGYYVLFGPDIHAWSSFCNINGNPICGTTP